MLARDRARTAIKAVYTAPEGMGDNEFEDAAALVRAIALIAKQTDIETGMVTPPPIQVPARSEVTEDELGSGTKEGRMTQQPSRSRKPRHRKSHESNSPSVKGQTAPKSKMTRAVTPTAASSASALDAREPLQALVADKLDVGSQTSSTSRMSDKERKRRRVEQAERALQRRNNREKKHSDT